MSNRGNKIKFVQPKIAAIYKDDDQNSFMENDGTLSLTSYSGSGVKSNDATTQSRRSLMALNSNLSRYAKSDVESETPKWEPNFQIRGEDSWNFFSHQNQSSNGFSPQKTQVRGDKTLAAFDRGSPDQLSSQPSLRVKSANGAAPVMVRGISTANWKMKTAGVPTGAGQYQDATGHLSPEKQPLSPEGRSFFSKMRPDENPQNRSKDLIQILGSGSGIREKSKSAEDATNVKVGSHFAVSHATYLKGKLRNELGDEFEGEICFGQAAGFGILRLSSRNYEYRGNFSDDLRHGQGEEYLGAETKTICYFEKGIRQGRFETHFPDGSVFKGTYHAGIPSLFGTFISCRGTQFNGNFIDGMLEGQATVEYSNGDRFVGNFHLNQRHGLGKLIWTSKKVLEGNWVDDETLENGFLFDPATNLKQKVSLINGKLMKVRSNIGK